MKEHFFSFLLPTANSKVREIRVIGYAELKVRGRKRKDYPTP
jgi:hypothetical protein